MTVSGETTGSAARMLWTVTRGAETLGYVAVDTLVAGRAQGGLRLLPDVTEAELRGLARAMTLKYGFLGLPQGGAKAGVRGDPEAPLAERRARLRAFGEAIAPLLRKGIYVPGADMGTTNDDIRALLAAAGMRPRRRQLRGTESGDYTAMTVFAGVRAALRYGGTDLARRAVAIEGFGKVGAPLARLVAEAGGRVVAVSTSRGALHDPDGLDVPRLLALARVAGSAVVDQFPTARRLEREELLELPVDVLCPCARHDTIHAGNMARARAAIIAPGANNPVTPEAETHLTGRGVVCLPDFVTNCGGVLGGTMAFASIEPARIAAFIERALEARITWLLGEANRRAVTPRAVVEEVALRRFVATRQAAEHPSLAGRLFGLALECHRRGWLPGRAVAALSMGYFERLLAPEPVETDR